MNLDPKKSYFDVVRLEHMNMMINPILSTMKLYATYRETFRYHRASLTALLALGAQVL